MDATERFFLDWTEGVRIFEQQDSSQEPKPVNWPGKVDTYRFMTFYLEPDIKNFDTFKETVADQIWLNSSNDPNAIALRQAVAAQADKKSNPWRILHRVTYVSRALPDYEAEGVSNYDE